MRSTFLAFIAGAVCVLAGTAIAQQVGPLFPDVATSAYFYDAVDRFARKAIIKGYDNGRFGPHDYVTRGQVAVILDRYDQTVVAPLRTQIELMRASLDLGSCGDGEKQSVEECDDGNLVDSDGCSADCILELHCAGGYKVGDRFPAADGCNICTCSEAGIACTKKACTQQKCFSSSECDSSEVCSVELGDCRYPCPSGAVCIQSCGGVCLPKEHAAVCGNDICEEGESPVPDVTAGNVYCPQDCNLKGVECGNKICEKGEAHTYTLGCEGDSTPCVQKEILSKKGSCPSDCEELDSCEDQKTDLDEEFATHILCSKDEDCTVFVRGCSPYQTCGKPVTTEALLDLTAKVLEYADVCETEGPTFCSGCFPNTVTCVSGVCTLEESSLE